MFKVVDTIEDIALVKSESSLFHVYFEYDKVDDGLITKIYVVIKDVFVVINNDVSIRLISNDVIDKNTRNEIVHALIFFLKDK